MLPGNLEDVLEDVARLESKSPITRLASPLSNIWRGLEDVLEDRTVILKFTKVY